MVARITATDVVAIYPEAMTDLRSTPTPSLHPR
jgi:hypothetical protein